MEGENFLVFIYFHLLTKEIELLIICTSVANCVLCHFSISMFIFFLMICKNSFKLSYTQQRFFPHCHFY